MKTTSARSKLSRGAVGVAASAATVATFGLIGAAPAHAAGSVWDRVAACESGGNWGISTGNGYYGGLQFSSSTWRAYGGGAYASSANGASKSQQIAVAQRVLAGQGAHAWPVCGPRAGLTSSSGGASSYSSSSSSNRSYSTRSYSTRSSSTRSYSTRSYSTRSYSNSRDRSTDESTERSYTPRRVATSGSTYSYSRTPEHYVARHAAGTVVVRSGDTLSKLAGRYGISGGWQRLWQLNRGTVHNPNLIFIGQVLRLS